MTGIGGSSNIPNSNQTGLNQLNSTSDSSKVDAQSKTNQTSGTKNPFFKELYSRDGVTGNFKVGQTTQRQESAQQSMTDFLQNASSQFKQSELELLTNNIVENHVPIDDGK